MKQKKCASAGNRTRAARVAGEHSTTEPPMLTYKSVSTAIVIIYWTVPTNCLRLEVTIK